MTQMTPREIVHELDKHIVGQTNAKRAVAIALRNRWRRSQVEESLRDEITPKNILMIGPTGVGKTEIARRLARLAHAPFIKVEATKFTEVGYVGRDVESIIRDLVEAAVKLTRQEEMAKVQSRAELAAEESVLDVLLPSADTWSNAEGTGAAGVGVGGLSSGPATHGAQQPPLAPSAASQMSYRGTHCDSHSHIQANADVSTAVVNAGATEAEVEEGLREAEDS